MVKSNKTRELEKQTLQATTLQTINIVTDATRNSFKIL